MTSKAQRAVVLKPAQAAAFHDGKDVISLPVFDQLGFSGGNAKETVTTSLPCGARTRLRLPGKSTEIAVSQAKKCRGQARLKFRINTAYSANPAIAIEQSPADGACVVNKLKIVNALLRAPRRSRGMNRRQAPCAVARRYVKPPATRCCRFTPNGYHFRPQSFFLGQSNNRPYLRRHAASA